jgi:hypothetical protein
MTRRRPKPSRASAHFAEGDVQRKNLPAEARGFIANARNDITIPFFTGVLQNTDETLLSQGRGKGLAIYDEIKRDPFASSMLDKRKKALTSRAVSITAGGERPIDQLAADIVREAIAALPFDTICEGLLDATLKGFAVGEAVWERDGARIMPTKIKVHDQRRFVFDHDWAPRLLTWSSILEGEALPERKFIVHRVGVQGNNPYGLGLGDRLFWPVLFKREGIAFWLHFLEKFAGPTIVGKTPYGMLADEQRRLLQNLSEAKTSSAILVPIGTDVQFLEASRSGSVSYEQFLAYWDKQISICTTGETLTTQVTESGGNRALGDVHQEQLDTLADSDGDQLTDTLQDQLVRWIVEYNAPGAALPKVERERPKNERAQAETRKAKADAAESLDRVIRGIVAAASTFDDDATAREYIVSFDVTDALSDKVIDALVAARHDFAGEASGPADPFVTADPAQFAARPMGRGLKKKLTGMSVSPNRAGR